MKELKRFPLENGSQGLKVLERNTCINDVAVILKSLGSQTK